MSKVPSFSKGQIESLARFLGECGTGADIDRILNDRGLIDSSGESTKWRRLYWVFQDAQRSFGCSSRVIDFIQAFLAPTRFIGRSDEFEEHLSKLNTVLAFSGLMFCSDGLIRQQDVAKTLDEAEQRVGTIRRKFLGRRIHPEVLKYCKNELMQDNYFHAVFEAAKGLMQRIRDMSGIQADGAELVDRVFSVNKPLLAFNTPQTETERSEYKGFAMLLKGCFAAIRNPMAHEPKILWESEDDAADYLSLISLLHRRLDSCVSTQPGGR